MVYLWRAVDAEGEVLDVLVQTRRNKRAALKLMRKLLKKYGFVPEKLITEPVILELRDAMNAVDGATIAPRIRICQPDEESARCKGSRASESAQRFLSTHAATYNTFNVQRHLTSARTHRAFRASAMQAWREVVAAA
jgi:transposase-like protein